MDIGDKARLEKLLGMLGSSFPNEAATAAAMIKRMADKHKLTIAELVAKAGQSGPAVPDSQSVYNEATGASAAAEAYRASARTYWRGPTGNLFPDVVIQMLRKLLASRQGLSSWEVEFLADVCSRYLWDHQLSAKQLSVARGIVERTQARQANG